MVEFFLIKMDVWTVVKGMFSNSNFHGKNSSFFFYWASWLTIGQCLDDFWYGNNRIFHDGVFIVNVTKLNHWSMIILLV